MCVTVELGRYGVEWVSGDLVGQLLRRARLDLPASSKLATEGKVGSLDGRAGLTE